MVGKIFLIESPFQLLCAIEANDHFRKGGRSIFILLNTFHDQNYFQLKRLAERFLAYHEYWLLNVNDSSFFQEFKTVISEVNDDVESSIIFLGDYRSVKFSKVILTFFPRNQLVLLDDGNINYILLHNLKIGSFSLDFKIRKMIGKLTGNPVHNLSPDIIFTYFAQNFDSKEIPLKVIQNNFKYIRHYSNKKARTNEVWFLGAKFVEAKMMSKDRYIDLIKKSIQNIRKRYPSLRIIYFPHRGECVEQIETTLSFLKVDVNNTGIPIELYLIESSKYPICISSFYSGALNTTKLILGDQCSFLSIRFSFHKTKSLRNNRLLLKNIRQSYNNLQESGIEILEIEE